MSGKQHKPDATGHGHPRNDSNISEALESAIDYAISPPSRSSPAQAGSEGKEMGASLAGGDFANSDHAMRNDTSSTLVASQGRTAGTVLGDTNINYAMANTPAPFHGIEPSSSSAATRSGSTAATPQGSSVDPQQQTGMHLQHGVDAASDVDDRPEHPYSSDFSVWKHIPSVWLEEDSLVWVMTEADRSGRASPPINDISAHVAAHNTWLSKAIERLFGRSPIWCPSRTLAAARSPPAPLITNDNLLDPLILPAHVCTHDKAPAGILSPVSRDLPGYNSEAPKIESAPPLAPVPSRPFDSPAPVITPGQGHADWRERAADMAARTWGTPTLGVNNIFGRSPLFRHQDAHSATPASPRYVPPRPARVENGGMPLPGLVDPRVIRPPVQRRESLLRIVGQPANDQSRQNLHGGNSARFINGQLRRSLRQIVADEHARRAEAAARAEEDEDADEDVDNGENGGGDGRGRALGSEVLLEGSLPDEEGPFDRQFAR